MKRSLRPWFWILFGVAFWGGFYWLGRSKEVTLHWLRGAPDQMEMFRVVLSSKEDGGRLEIREIPEGFPRAQEDVSKPDRWTGFFRESGEPGGWVWTRGETPPWFFGGGLGGVLRSFSEERTVSNLSFFQKIFLCFWAGPLPEEPWRPERAQAPKTVHVDLPGLLPTPERALRIAVLNGCGVPRAADAVAKRIERKGVSVVRVENADHFRYPRTILRTSVGVPVAVEEILAKIGLSGEQVEEVQSAGEDVEVTVIVGKDYRQLRRKW